MTSTGVVRIVLVFALTCCLVSSEDQNHSNENGITLTGKTGSFVGNAPEAPETRYHAPEEVHPRMRKHVTPLVTGACLSGDEAKVCKNASLPLLVFVVGVEGSGHNLVYSMFSHMSSFAIQVGYTPQQHLYDPTFEVTTLFYAIIEKELHKQRMGGLLQLMAKAKNDQKLGTVVFASSFPMGMHGGTYSTSRPDLIALKDFECELYRIKFLVTRRHPLATVLSAVRRFGGRVAKYDKFQRIPQGQRAGLDEKNLTYTVTARIAEDNLIYIDQQIRQLGCHQVHFMDYDKVINESTRTSALQELAAFLELSEPDTEELLSTKIVSPHTKVAIPPNCTQCIEKTLYDFFEERKMMWPLLQQQ